MGFESVHFLSDVSKLSFGRQLLRLYFGEHVPFGKRWNRQSYRSLNPKNSIWKHRHRQNISVWFTSNDERWNTTYSVKNKTCFLKTQVDQLETLTKPTLKKQTVPSPFSGTCLFWQFKMIASSPKIPSMGLAYLLTFGWSYVDFLFHGES